MTATRAMSTPIEGPGPHRGGLGSDLQFRWLGTVEYTECWDLQRALFTGTSDHLLLCQHRPVFTLGRNGDASNLLVDPAKVGAEVHRVD
ncbi:MAG: hypothetical protein GY939_12360, partial [Actinomycetia bacterium]|nr:hypothetical protein [Actinomycetes bacterium]